MRPKLQKQSIEPEFSRLKLAGRINDMRRKSVKRNIEAEMELIEERSDAGLSHKTEV